MPRTSRRLIPALAALAAGAAVAAPTAAAAPVDLDGGTTTLRLAPATAAALGDLGLSVSPVGPARVRGGAIAFPVTGGAIDARTAAGRIDHSGGLAFSAGGTTVRVTDFVVRTDQGSPVLTARAGSARVPLLDLDLDDAVVLRRGAGGVGTWVVRVQASLTATGAAALNAAFGSELAAGTPIGRVDVRTDPAEVELAGGATTLSLDAGTAAALTSLGVAPGVIAPGSASTAGLAFPVTGGVLAAGSFAGTIAHSGGISLTAGATRVELKNFRITVDADPDLSAQVGDTSARVPLDVDLSTARTGLSRQTAVVRGARVTLTAAAAGALNAAFGTTALSAGLPLGVADVRARVR